MAPHFMARTSCDRLMLSEINPSFLSFVLSFVCFYLERDIVVRLVSDLQSALGRLEV